MFCFKHDASHISKLMEKGDFTKVYEELLKFDPNVMNNSEVLPNVMKFYILKSKMCHHIFKGEGEWMVTNHIFQKNSNLDITSF